MADLHAQNARPQGETQDGSSEVLLSDEAGPGASKRMREARGAESLRAHHAEPICKSMQPIRSFSHFATHYYFKMKSSAEIESISY